VTVAAFRLTSVLFNKLPIHISFHIARLLFTILHTFIYFLALVAFMANEYIRVPAIAMEDPIMDPVLMGVLNAMTEATMMTTRLMVFPTA